MHWTHLALITLGVGLLSSLTDWLCAGDWIHRRFTYPEIWRPQTETRAIAIASVFPFVTCGVFAWMLASLGVHTLSATCKLATAVWLIGPLPITLTNAAIIKLHRVFVFTFSLGWLVKLLFVALAVTWFF